MVPYQCVMQRTEWDQIKDPHVAVGGWSQGGLYGDLLGGELPTFIVAVG